uniref:NADH-ubiquinone oxidoreductase chain 2 n=1 Tax=Meloimorpha japonica TaxID=1109092 RepID=A0A385I1X7_9ORTH|nr:NADH dehydrogenase subunit 2 [Meloimorpha japonica]AXY63911.1 NADH dehydrogenase subunit 2 [Meloimorpha japonica]
MFNILINPSKILFLITLLMGTMMSISSNSWPAMWMGLEINMLSFIPLMMTPNHLSSSESSMKYFLIQAMASSMFLMFIILSFFKMNYMIHMHYYIQTITSMTLLIKMGAAPFHMWFPIVMEGLSWNNCLLLMTWQKIAPMVMLLTIHPNMTIMYLSIILSITVGSIGGLNQTSTRKIMAYSSINHIGWMLMAMSLSSSLWLIYFLIYMIVSSSMLVFFSKLSNFHFNQLPLNSSMSGKIKMMIMLNMLSLGGLPPMLGFIPKWLIIQSCNHQPIVIFMVLMSLITLFYYMRLMMSMLMLNFTQLKWSLVNKTNITYIIPAMTIVSTAGFTLFPIIYLFP